MAITLVGCSQKFSKREGDKRTGKGKEVEKVHQDGGLVDCCNAIGLGGA